MENKNNGNESKIIFRDFSSTMDKIDRYGQFKTRRIYRCCSKNVLSKLIVGNGLKDLWRRETQSSPATIDPLVQDSG